MEEKRVISDKDIQEATNEERARMLKNIAQGKAIYTQDIQTH